MIESQITPGTKPSLANEQHFVPGVVTKPASPLHNYDKPTSVTDIVRSRGSFWTADELAEVLTISRKHIYKLAKNGRVPCYRMGGAIRFDPEQIAQWLERRAIN